MFQRFLRARTKSYLRVLTGDREFRERVRSAYSENRDVRAVIAADGGSAHRSVVHVIDLLRQERVTKFAINVDPDAITKP